MSKNNSGDAEAQTLIQALTELAKKTLATGMGSMNGISLELEGLLLKLLSGATLEIQAQIRVVPSEDGKPKLKVVNKKTRVKRS